jgi:hypothetical protein
MATHDLLPLMLPLTPAILLLLLQFQLVNRYPGLCIPTQLRTQCTKAYLGGDKS